MGHDPSSDLALAITPRPDGVTVEAWVVPGAVRTEITGLHGAAVRIRVAAPATGGRANRVVISLLETVTGGDVELLLGARGRRKKLLVRGVTHRDVLERISEQAG